MHKMPTLGGRGWLVLELAKHYRHRNRVVYGIIDMASERWPKKNI